MNVVYFIVGWLSLNGWVIIQLLKKIDLYAGNEQKTFRLLLFNGLGIPPALVFGYYTLLYPSSESVASGGNTVNVIIGAVIVLLLTGWLLYHFYSHRSPRSLDIIVTASTVISSLFGYLSSVLITLLLRSF